MNRTRRVVLAGLFGLIGSCLPAASQAHFLWVSFTSPKSIAVAFQERPGDEALDIAERQKLIKGIDKGGKAIPLQADGFVLNGAAGQAAGALLDYGVIDRSGQGRGVFWLKYYAKAATSIKDSQTSLGLPVEVSVSKKADGAVVVHVTRDGKPAAGADVVLESGPTPPQEGAPGVKTDAQGNVEFKSSSDPICVRALVVDNSKGSQGGLNYESIRSYCSLVVGLPAAKPLTAQIQDVFGKNHEIVQKTDFIKTVFSGKVTKAQLQDHLRQRAFVHEEIDRIMRKGKVSPYQDQQREVLDLLKIDMDSVGAAWPKAAEAWPITNDFLKAIRESEKKGPYFALGVFHVYYGGITHGGRDIGAKIKEYLGYDLTYYQMGDGYKAYVANVNQILKPEDQKEMIRGGVAAYRYIIDSNNLPAFGSK
jgi:hypothetical protein